MAFKYPKNLRFKCTKCGLCCGDTKTKTRHILLLQADAERIAAHTNRPVLEFAKETKGTVPYVFEMCKNPASGMCIFLQNNQCTIYAQRPLICRFYPFELATDEQGTFVFKETDECPGINCQEAKKLSAPFFAELLERVMSELH